MPQCLRSQNLRGHLGLCVKIANHIMHGLHVEKHGCYAVCGLNKDVSARVLTQQFNMRN